jgi:hypothetical protein
VLQIAWINTTPVDPGDMADVTIWDPIEHRIEVFHADTGLFATANRGEIVDRATELLRNDGYIVHAVEPNGADGFAAIVELVPA